MSLKGKYAGINSPLYGKKHTEETKHRENKKFYGKIHTDQSKELIKQKAIGRKHFSSHLEKMSKVRGNPVNVYEKCSSEGFKLIAFFISARKPGLFLEISGSTIIKYMHFKEIFKNRYKFSSR